MSKCSDGEAEQSSKHWLDDVLSFSICSRHYYYLRFTLFLEVFNCFHKLPRRVSAESVWNKENYNNLNLHAVNLGGLLQVYLRRSQTANDSLCDTKTLQRSAPQR